VGILALAVAFLDSWEEECLENQTKSRRFLIEMGLMYGECFTIL
jgi:hypothetical protein